MNRLTKFRQDEHGFIDLNGIQYPLYAGLGAIIGLVFCLVILLPLSLVWPPVWDAAIWVLGGFTVAGIFVATQID